MTFANLVDISRLIQNKIVALWFSKQNSHHHHHIFVPCGQLLTTKVQVFIQQKKLIFVVSLFTSLW